MKERCKSEGVKDECARVMESLKKDEDVRERILL